MRIIPMKSRCSNVAASEEELSIIILVQVSAKLSRPSRPCQIVARRNLRKEFAKFLNVQYTER
jgi:hypothetical protein